MYNTPTPEALEIVKQLREEIKKYYLDLRKRDEYLLSKANLESNAGEKVKANTIINIKKAERRNQYYQNFHFHQGTRISAQKINRIQIPKSWKTTEEYVENADILVP